MTTYPLSFLSDYLGFGDVTLDMQRNDEMSGSGDGRYWTAQLARPLWTVTASLHPVTVEEARDIDAAVRALNGSSRAFLFSDPTYTGPLFGATVELAQSTVKVRAINTARTRVALSGLPPGFVISRGDRFSVEWAPGRYYMATFIDADTAISNGTTAGSDIYPYPPLALEVGMTVNLIQPTISVIIPPGGWTPFTVYPGPYAGGASIKILQKV